MSSESMPMEEMKEQELQKEKLKRDTVKTMTPVDLTERSQAGMSLPALRQRELSIYTCTASFHWTPYLEEGLKLGHSASSWISTASISSNWENKYLSTEKGGQVAYHQPSLHLEFYISKNNFFQKVYSILAVKYSLMFEILDIQMSPFVSIICKIPLLKEHLKMRQRGTVQILN